jgi:YidC/Oxa1 family membrane protein insertase
MSIRSFLWLALAVTLFFIWQAWERDYGTPGVPTLPALETPTSNPTDTPLAPAAPDATSTGEVPVATSAPPPAMDPSSVASAPAASAATPRVTIETDVLRLQLDTAGGSIVAAELLAYPLDPSDRTRVVRLLTDTPDGFFVAQSGLVSAGGVAPDHRAVFSAAASEYRLGAGADTLEVPLTWRDEASGLVLTLTYRFARGSYAIEAERRIENRGSAPWSGSEYRQLQRTSPLLNRKFSFTNPEQYSFAGVSWFSPEQRFEKLAFDAFVDEPLKRDITGGWAAQQQHYFFAAWIPPAAQANSYATDIIDRDGPNPRYLVRQLAPAVTVAPGAETTLAARLYIGPKLQSNLPDIAPGLEYTVDYGMVTFIAEPLFSYVLSPFQKLVGNWGFAIILTTLVIKLLLYPLSEAQYRSFAKMRKMTPRMQALKERYGDDRQKLNQAMMELYQKEKINPLGGCLPILLQIPVFIALYWVLLESVELRQAPFIGWIQNLSDRDPYFILPILNAVVMYVQQRMTPMTGMDPMQQRVMQMMPVIFSVMFAFFPAGLVLYWTVNGLLGLLQQWVITRRIEKGAAA